jgi:hypothetical protein
VKRVEQLEVKLSVRLAGSRVKAEPAADEIRSVSGLVVVAAGATPVGAGAAGAAALAQDGCALEWRLGAEVRAAGGDPAAVDVPALPVGKFVREGVNSGQRVAGG